MAAPRHDWYLRQWLHHLGKKQADVVNDLDWNKARVSLMVRGEQQYTRDAVNELADYLHIRPYELLMHPDDAMALRKLRREALTVVETSRSLDEVPDQEEALTGT
jgi:plasmid maintenance system antidote protein VapI